MVQPCGPACDGNSDLRRDRVSRDANERAEEGKSVLVVAVGIKDLARNSVVLQRFVRRDPAEKSFIQGTCLYEGLVVPDLTFCVADEESASHPQSSSADLDAQLV